MVQKRQFVVFACFFFRVCSMFVRRGEPLLAVLGIAWQILAICHVPTSRPPSFETDPVAQPTLEP